MCTIYLRCYIVLVCCDYICCMKQYVYYDISIKNYGCSAVVSGSVFFYFDQEVEITHNYGRHFSHKIEHKDSACGFFPSKYIYSYTYVGTTIL